MILLVHMQKHLSTTRPVLAHHTHIRSSLNGVANTSEHKQERASRRLKAREARENLRSMKCI